MTIAAAPLRYQIVRLHRRRETVAPVGRMATDPEQASQGVGLQLSLEIAPA